MHGDPRSSTIPAPPVTTSSRREPVPGTESAVAAAIARIAPLWPLDRFVAVHPYQGLVDLDLEEATALLEETAAVRILPPREVALAAIDGGEIDPRDYREARDRSPRAHDLPADLEAAARLLREDPHGPRRPRVPTIAELSAPLAGVDAEAFVVDRVASWWGTRCTPSTWPSAWRALPPWEAWCREARVDRTPRFSGLHGWSAVVTSFPTSVDAAIADALARLDVPPPRTERYLLRLLHACGGWAATLRRIDRENGDDHGSHVRALLAMLLAWEVALLERRGDDTLPSRCQEAWERFERSVRGSEDAAADALDAVLLHAREETARRRRWRGSSVVGPGDRGRARSSAVPLPRVRTEPSRRGAPGRAREEVRPSACAVFCIDVRSEVVRRALEESDPTIETRGFAGFFGMPIEVREESDASERGVARCPVLIEPAVAVDALPADEGARAPAGSRPWKRLPDSTVGSFPYVETLGLTYAWRMVREFLVRESFGFGRRSASRPEPSAVVGRLSCTDRATGEPLGLAARADLAEGALRGMGALENFPRLFVLVGHGSTSTNNLHASGLECGACGGHSGDTNARLLASLLRDPAIRAELAARGIAIPDDTVFLAALHDTTADTIRVLDRSACPPSHTVELDRLEARFRRAGRRARSERAVRFRTAAGDPVDAASLASRGSDPSQPRPEWGLAGCHSFIAAPRARTRGLDLEGGAFLHSYDPAHDPDGAVLEQILTAPLVVASWIHFQYWASTVAPRVFGAGDKALHNAVGSIGVLEGAGGDLRPGLPWQSVHDGVDPAHAPLRFDAIVEASPRVIEAIIERHEDLRRHLDGGWLHLFAIDERGVWKRRVPGLGWRACTAAPHATAPHAAETRESRIPEVAGATVATSVRSGRLRSNPVHNDATPERSETHVRSRDRSLDR